MQPDGAYARSGRQPAPAPNAGRPCSLRRATVFVAAGVLFTGVLALAYAVHEATYFDRRFAEVTPGLLFRSCQPRGSQWRYVAGRGIRTVVNLRLPEESPDDFEDSRRGCAENHLHLVNIPVDESGPSDEQLETFLRVCGDPDQRPVLVHCEHGRKRTGLFVGLYGVVFEGWSEAEALDAVKGIYGKSLPRQYAALLRRVARDREAWLARLPSAVP